MSKAIIGAAEIGVAFAATAWVGGIGGLAVLSAQGGMLGLYAGATVSLALSGVAMEAGAISQALSTNRGMGITTRQPASFRQIIRGMQRVGGVIVYSSTTGSTKRQYNLVIVLATHPCEAITDLYLDGRKVYWNTSSPYNMTMPDGTNFGGYADPGTYYGPNGVAYSFGSEVFCQAHMGTQTASNIDNTPLYNNDPTWAPTSNGTPYLAGCTWVYLKLEADSGTFPQFPEIRFTVKGKNDIFDPRTNTTGYTTNWALHIADAITDANWGLGDNTVNQAQLIAAANVCDEMVTCAAGSEKRYSLHWHYDTSLSPGDAIAQMMDAAAGRLSRIGGEWYIWPAYWQGPSFTLDESALLAPLQWTPKRSLNELCNRVTGTYCAPNYPYNVAGDLYDSNGYYEGQTQNNFPYAFQPTNFPEYACDQLHGYGAGVDVYLTQDGGVYLPREVQQPCILSISQAQRVAKILLLRNRQQGTGKMMCSLAAWDMQPTDVMQFNMPSLNWVNKVLEIDSVKFHAEPLEGQHVPACTLEIGVQETDQSVYEWNSATEELSPYDVPVVNGATSTVVPPPSSVTIEDDATTELITQASAVIPRLLVQWVAPLDNGVNNGGHIEVQYQFTTNPGDPQPPSTLNPTQNGDGSWTTEWIDAGSTSGQSTSIYVQGVAPYRKMSAQVRAVRANGGCSVWVVTTGYTYGRSFGNPVAPAGTLTAQALSGGTAQISIANFTTIPIGGLTEACTPSPSVLTGLNQGEVYEVYYIDAAFAGGTITPVATQNPADYLGKTGYFLIGIITTPTYSTRYRPSTYSDVGSSTTQQPQAAYDGDVTTSAAVLGQWGSSGTSPNFTYWSTSGDCIWSGFPKVTTSSILTLYIIAESSSGGTGPFSGAITATIAGVATTVATFTGSSAEQTYTVSVPSGTDLSTVVVEARASVTQGSSPGSGTLALEGFEIYIQ